MKRFTGLLNRNKSMLLHEHLAPKPYLLTTAPRQRLQQLPRRLLCTCRLPRSKCCAQHPPVLRISFRRKPRRRGSPPSSDRRGRRVLTCRGRRLCPTNQALPQSRLCHQASCAVQCHHAGANPERQPWTNVHPLLRPELCQDCERAVERMQGSRHAADPARDFGFGGSEQGVR